VEAATITILRICASYCRTAQGQAFWLEQSTTPPTLGSCSFVECSAKGDEDADSGAVACESGVALAVTYGNFTNCYVAGYSILQHRYGSGICLRGHNYDSDAITYSTFVGCGGYSTVDARASSATTRLTIDRCIFSGDDNDLCLIYIEQGPVTVISCYFTQSKANTANFVSESSSCVFTITNCFLDRAGLSGASYSGNSGNVFNVAGRTPYISIKNTVYCSAAPAPATSPLRSPEQSLAPTAARTIVPRTAKRGVRLRL
jgi:hypothetical protein